MNEVVGKYMDRAESALDSADILLTSGQTLALANRAYYAVFYCICALLSTKHVNVKKHHAARAKFGELFINSNVFPKEASKIVGKNFAARQSADYDVEAQIDQSEAAELLDGARLFYQMTLDYFTQKPIH